MHSNIDLTFKTLQAAETIVYAHFNLQIMLGHLMPTLLRVIKDNNGELKLGLRDKAESSQLKAFVLMHLNRMNDINVNAGLLKLHRT